MMPLRKKIKIAILIPCHNEGLAIEACVKSCLNQTRLPDEIVVVDDKSTDNSVEILETFGKRIKLICLKKNMGNKSFVQQHGLKFIKSDVFVATDGDTILHPNFIALVEKNFQDPAVAAMGGYIESLKYNWITAIRQIDYVVGQNIHKLAQSYLGFMFVIPGCAGAFRTDLFRTICTFDHDTITEDLDFTYKLHRFGARIKYERGAIVYTQDPPTLHSYINQMRRWYAGGWQNLLKHYHVAGSWKKAFELTLMYVEGVLFAALLFIVPLLNLNFFLHFMVPYGIFIMATGVYAAIKSRRMDLVYYAPTYVVFMFINAWIFLETFFKEVVIRRRTVVWFQPKRVKI